MRSKSFARVLLVLAGLMALGTVPARAAESLVLTCTVCTTVVATGKGLPANETVQLKLVDVASGQAVVAPVPIQTDADGAFVKSVAVDLTKYPSLASSVWRTEGSVLVVAAHSRFDSPCKPKGPALPLTGSNTPLLLGLGAALLAAGGLLLGGTRLRPRHAR
jgi:hypothetical protein